MRFVSLIVTRAACRKANGHIAILYLGDTTEVHSSTRFTGSSPHQCYLNCAEKSIHFLPDQLYSEEFAVKKDKAFSDNLCGTNKSLLNKCFYVQPIVACSFTVKSTNVKKIPGPFYSASPTV